MVGKWEGVRVGKYEGGKVEKLECMKVQCSMFEVQRWMFEAIRRLTSITPV